MGADMTVAKDVTEWLHSRGALAAPTENEDLYKSGHLDSFGLVELIAFCESRYAITFEDADFANPAFRTLKGLADIVAMRGGAVPGVRE